MVDWFVRLFHGVNFCGPGISNDKASLYLFEGWFSGSERKMPNHFS